MTLPIAKRLLSCACALILATAPDSTQAGGFFYAGYAPSACCGTYYTSYAPSYYGYTGYYGTAYRGFGLWGTSYISYYAPTYSACYGSSCNPCGYGACGVSYGGCGIACNPCGGCYNPCGSCCNACGVSGCDGCGISCAPSASPASGNTPTPDYTQPPPRGGGSTYDEDTPDDFRRPAPPDGAAEGRGEAFRPEGIGGEDDGGTAEFQRTEKPPSDVVEETIRPRSSQPADDAAPADVEPGAAEDTDSEADEPSKTSEEPADTEAEVPPLTIESDLAAGVAPKRNRLRYTVRFRTPQVARVDVAPSPNSKWVPLDTETRLAASK